MGSLLPQATFDRLRAMCPTRQPEKPKTQRLEVPKPVRVIIARPASVNVKELKVKIVLEDAECHYCGTKFTPTRPDRIYCTRDCQKKGNRRNRRHFKIKAFRVPIACGNCGVEFTPFRKPNKYCSDACCVQDAAVRRRGPIVTKTCVDCNASFETSQSGRLFCSDKCRYRYNRVIHKRTNRLKSDALKANLKCVRCGENHPGCLDFHHRDPETKLFAISKGVGRANKSWESIQAEINKCDVLCANCHRKEHWSNPIAFDVRATKETNVRKED